MDNLYAQVLFDFNANFADELSVKSGEILQILYKIDSDWVYAKNLITQNDSGGIIPVNFLKISKLPNYLFETNGNVQLKLFLATDDFGEESGDLNFVKNELLIGQSCIDSNWYFGHYLNDQQKKGIFPVSHVTPIYYSPQLSQKQSVNEFTKSPRQAKAIHLFENESSDSNYSYLKFKPGDYLLILDTLDDNWYMGQNLNGNKGLVPSKYVEFMSENDKILCFNNTQQSFKHTDILEIKIEDEKLVSSPSQSLTDQAKYCRVEYDFQSESEPELSCLTGEYLKILRINRCKSEWVEVENIYGRKGMVPLSFVKLIHETDSTLDGLFETKIKLRNKSINEINSNKSTKINNNKSDETINLKEVDTPNETRSKSIRESISLFQEKINQTKKENQIVEQQRSRLTTRSYHKPSDTKSYSTSPKLSLNSEHGLFTVYRPPPDPPIKIREEKTKPPIPPKPVKIINNRPIVFNNELLTKIKDLESIISEKQNTSVLTSNETNNSDKENTPQNIECLKTNLSNMKNLFVESAQNRQIAMAQIETVPNESINLRVEEEELLQNKDFDSNEKLKRRQHEREMTIKELYQTEKDFFNELNLVYETFVTNCTAYIPSGFNRNALFDNLKPVVEFSQRFVAQLEQELNLNDDNLIKIGLCLIDASQEIKEVYAPYLQNHTNVNQLIKNYESNIEIANFIKSRIDLFRDQIKVVNLQSILIKPVQRIFKYPLFIKRIQENTVSNHIDYKNLERAGELYTKILEYINEYKRRKDLINKYLQTNQPESNDISISEIFKKLSMKSFAKKTTRLTVQISSALGLFNQKIFDQNFIRLFDEFKLIEKTVRKFTTDLDDYMLSLKDVLKNEKLLFNHLLYIFEDEFHTFIIFETSSHKRYTDEFRLYSDLVKKQVMLPMVTLLNYFNGPLKLINKRNDKLVDYEALLSDFEMRSTNTAGNGNGSVLKESEARLDQAKRDYDALNNQLIEDLPKLNKSSMKILVNLVKKFLNLTLEFYAKIKSDLDQEIEKAHFQVTSSSNVPKLNITFQRNGSMFYNSEEQNHVQKQSFQTDEHICRLKTKFSTDNLFRVFKEYQPDDKLCQLDQKINDIVGLIKPYDPAGQRHIWLVDNGHQRGFIPCEVLEKYVNKNESQIEEEQINLIDFEDDSDLMSSKSEISYLFDHSTLQNKTEKFEDLLKLETKSEKYCIAMFDFKPIKDNMIDLVEGKLYKVKEDCDISGNKEWWLVEDNNDKSGYVPANYVKLLD